jgi:hypothetical protein
MILHFLHLFQYLIQPWLDQIHLLHLLLYIV